MREYRKFAVRLLEDPSIFVDFLLIFLGQSAGILFLLPKENYPFWVPLISPSLVFLGLSLHNMAEAEEIRHAHQARDLLKRLSRFPGKFLEKAEYEEEEIELSLGLSLNGRFGVDPKRTTTLTRSSSIADCILTTDRGKTVGAAPPSADSSLIRTCSLPAQTEEEWRKRKELQSLRRMEAKRKRIEKLKNLRTVKERVAVEPNGVCSTPVNAGRGSESQPLSQGSSGSSGISESETPVCWILHSRNKQIQ
ncbi:ninja-family protein AFP1-like isoform X2 [Diospyros lotus]|uniref:ninja-family protein AFP1-like isoform X2 n=1 Tax=Diospyros lotus TaxID=55363 RepID=UPI0022531269|nr:ninja-family protein AFP1-like isoform X2 [Diospyros lotus]